MIEEEDIELWYADLYPFLSQWGDSREMGFDRAFKHFHSMSCSEMVAWEINGFLMGIWLALQDHVDSVIYGPSKKYMIRRDTMESEFEKFLQDKELQLLSSD
jgi:hypothetical protein